MGCHLNGATTDGAQMSGMRVEACRFTHNGVDGTGNLDCSFCADLVVEDTLIALGNGGLALHGDGQTSARFGVQKATLRRCTIYEEGGNHGVRLQAGSRVWFEACILALARGFEKANGTQAVFDAITAQHRAEGADFAKAAAWVEAGTYRSLVSGVGYQG